MAPIRHVVAALELGGSSPLVLAASTRIARACRARLTLLHVSPRRIDGAQSHELECRLLDLIPPEDYEELRPETVIACGRPASAILEAAVARHADLVVVGRDRHSDLHRLFFESAGEVVTRDARCSVLVVPETPQAEALPSRVLCAVDMTASSAATLDAALAVARAAGAHLTVQHVVENWFWPDAPATGNDELVHLRRQVAHAIRERLAALLAARGAADLPVERLVSFGVPPLEIASAAAARNADLVVVGAHSRRLLGHTFLGSTARYLLAEPRGAVLLARPDTAVAVQAVAEPVEVGA